MRAIAGAFLAVIAFDASAASERWISADTVDALDTCVQATRPAADAEPWQRLVDLERHCPRVHRWLGARHDDRPPGSISLAAPSHRQLVELQALAQAWRDDVPPTATRRPLRAALDPILDEVTSEPERPRSLWQRFVDWVGGRFRDEVEDPGWLYEWLDALDVPDWMRDWSFRIAMLLVVVAALAVIVNEARLFGWRRRSVARSGEAGSHAADDTGQLPDWPQIDALPPRERVAAAVRRMVTEVAARLDIRVAFSRTNRELVGALFPGVGAGGADVDAVLADIDAILYGARTVNGDQAASLARACRRIAAGEPRPVAGGPGQEAGRSG